MIPDIEDPHQGIRLDSDLAPGVDKLGPGVHEVKAVYEGLAGSDAEVTVQLPFEEVLALQAHLRQLRPHLAQLLEALVARLGDDRHEQVDDLLEAPPLDLG